MAGRGLRTDVFAYDYNQMDEDYNNPELNSYDTGPGSHFSSSLPNENVNTKLHVTNIPTGLTEEGLMNIFSSEGDVPESVYIHRRHNHQSPSTSWGFVTFKSVAAAQTAMISIHKRPPYNFFVHFARCNEDDKSDGCKDRQSLDCNRSSVKSPKESITPSSRGRGKLPPMRGQPPSVFKALRSNDEPYIDELGDDYSPGKFSHCGTSFELNASNSVFSPYAEGEYDDGKRKMTMGRGSFIAAKGSHPVEVVSVCSVKEEYQDMEHRVAAYFGNQTKGFLFDNDAVTSSETKLSLPIKPGYCAYCSRPAIYICSKCKSWYCTNYCRKKDWIVHKNSCVPRVLEFQDGNPVYKLLCETLNENLENGYESKTESIGNSSHNGAELENDKSSIISKNYQANVNDEKSSSDTNKTNKIPKKDTFNHENRNESKGGGENPKGKLSNKKPMQRFYESMESDIFVKAPPPLHNVTHTNMQETKSRILGNSPIPENIFTKVTVGALEKDGEFIAYRVDEYIKQGNMMMKLNEYCSNGNNATRFEVGAKCVAPFDENWYRAEIIQIFPDNVKVKFIDFGNESDVKKGEIKMLPEDLCSEPPMAHKFIMAASLTNPKLKEELTIAIKPVSQDAQGRWVVHAEGADYSETYEKLEDGAEIGEVHGNDCFTNLTHNHVKHFLSLIQINGFTSLQIESVMNDEFLTGSIMDSGQIPVYQEFSKIMNEEVVSDNDMKLIPGMTLAVKWKNDWYRGYLMVVRDKNPVVALIDKGKVVVPQEVAKLPPKFLFIPECGVRVIFENPLLNKKLVGETVCVKNIQYDYKNNYVQGEIEDFGIVIMVPWVPTVEEAGLDCIHIPSGSKVQISSYHSPSAIYVQSCDPKYKTMLSELIQDVASCCTKGENLKRKPLIGEFLACRYIEDGYYYRAQVFQKEGEKFKVNFVDYGNTELVTLADMKQLPENLKRVPCCAVKVGLKDVPNIAFNTQCMKFLNELAANTIEMFLAYKKDLREVTLELSQGDIINNVLFSFLEPSWNKSDYNPLRSHVFMINDVKYESWKKGSKFLIAVSSVIKHDTILTLRPASSLLNHIECTLTPRITEYCESRPNEPYNPRRSELCLAKFHEDEKWYRALCLKSCQHNASEVFYLDYGNAGEVLHRCIRKMVPEFMEAPAVLKCCKIFGLPKKVPEPALSQIKEFLSTFKGEVEVIDEIGEGYYLIWIPALESFASQLGIAIKQKSS